MVRVYDNWDRLVRATVRRERFRQSALRTPSDLSSSSSFNFSVHQSGRLSFDFDVESPNLRIFSFSELKTATRNFRSHTILGIGDFGKVYKGWIDESSSSKGGSGSVIAVIGKLYKGWFDESSSSKGGSGSVIAVKRWDSESMQSFEEFQSEVKIHGWFNHPNIVKLLGYCKEENELLHVYEFMQKGSLENHLFRRGSTPQPLPWDIRLKILIGVAKGLAFLHASERPIILGDIKPSNILLDSSYNARISHVGLAMIKPTVLPTLLDTVPGTSDDLHPGSFNRFGTHVYAAPEYIETGRMYVESDVYGFGVVLVEMLTGLRAMDTTRPSGQHRLVEWIRPCLSDRRKLKKVMDVRLEGKYPLKAAVGIARLSRKCLEYVSKARPSMQEVVDTLERFESANGRPREPMMN